MSDLLCAADGTSRNWLDTLTAAIRITLGANCAKEKKNERAHCNAFDTGLRCTYRRFDWMGDVMICYKDRTFCVQDTCAKRDNCGNYLSEGHKRNAEKSGLPIAQALYLGCFVAESTPLIAQGATDAVH